MGTDPCQLYAAQFSKTDSSLVAAGGSGANEAKVYLFLKVSSLFVFVTSNVPFHQIL